MALIVAKPCLRNCRQASKIFAKHFILDSFDVFIEDEGIIQSLVEVSSFSRAWHRRNVVDVCELSFFVSLFVHLHNWTFSKRNEVLVFELYVERRQRGNWQPPTSVINQFFNVYGLSWQTATWKKSRKDELFNGEWHFPGSVRCWVQVGKKVSRRRFFFGSWTFWAAPGSKIKSGDFFETQLVRLDRIENWLSRHLRRARRVLKMSEGQDFRCRRGETSVDGGKEVETGRARESFSSLERVQSSWAFGFLECESTPWKLKLLSEKSFLLKASIHNYEIMEFIKVIDRFG